MSQEQRAMAAIPQVEEVGGGGGRAEWIGGRARRQSSAWQRMRARWLQGRRSSVRLWSRARRGRGDTWPGRGGGSAWPGRDGNSPTMKSIGKEIEKKIRKRESWVGPIGKHGLSSPCRPGGSIPRVTERIFHVQISVRMRARPPMTQKRRCAPKVWHGSTRSTNHAELVDKLPVCDDALFGKLARLCPR
jgi:hypothetical protein